MIALYRLILVAAFPFVLAWTIISTLCIEIGLAFCEVWLEIQSETKGFVDTWQEIPDHFSP